MSQIPVWPPEHTHPILRWLGRAFGIAYILVTLLFGPIKWLAWWLAQQRFIRKYQATIATLPPPLGLAVSVLSLGLLEISKLAVLLTYRRYGLLAAILATIVAKASLGYAAHTTWHAARPKVITAYPWAARADAWVGQQITRLKTARDHVLAMLRPLIAEIMTVARKIRANLFGELR